MTNKNWKTVWKLGWAIYAIGFIWAMVIHFQHWEEILSGKEKFIMQLPAMCVWLPGSLIGMLGAFKK